MSAAPRQAVLKGAQDPLEGLALAPAILSRLAAEGVHSLEEWTALGRRRLSIFGITRAMARRLDQLARVRR